MWVEIKKEHLFVVIAALCCSVPASAQSIETGYNTYGYPGLIDMPTAFSRPDAELAFTSSYFKNQLRNTLTFQITPRLSGSFRYSNLYDIRTSPTSPVFDFVFDRSFSLHYRLRDETAYLPAVALGLNDFVGTSLYSSEYIVASKTITPRFRVTGGLGWGRLAGVNSFSNPLSVFDDRFDTRPRNANEQGGLIRTNNWFRGDAAPFGGIEWQANERLTLTAEYSSDAYSNEDGNTFDYKIPFNFGATYRLRPNVLLSANYLYGSEIGAQVTFVTNPKNPPNFGGLDKAPPAVVPRPVNSAAALGWGDRPGSRSKIQNDLQTALAAQGITLYGFDLNTGSVRVQIENDTYLSTAQAIGRTARMMTAVMPGSITRFTVVPILNGVPGSSVSLNRSDLEQLDQQLDNSWESYTRAEIERVQDAGDPLTGLFPRFDYGFTPYAKPGLFDPDAPLRLDLGVAASATYEPAPGLVFSGRVRQKIIGNLDSATRESTSVIQKVRSEGYLYDKATGPTLQELTASYFFKPRADIYGRVTVGYLEEMYGGLSAELLWTPTNSSVSFGLEANYVKQRDFDQRFGFRDYAVATGHASVYRDVGNGFHITVDAGRYLAGDWGATLTVDREFKNGWKIGTFATLTDVSFDDFGEGSFDKGITLTIPINWLSGNPRKDNFSTTLRPVLRDGGARVNVPNRLYEVVRGSENEGLRESWGRFWR